MWLVLELFLMFIVATFIISQIIIPSFCNVRYFWLFKKTTKQLSKLEDEMKEAEEEFEINNLTKKKNKIKGVNDESI